MTTEVADAARPANTPRQRQHRLPASEVAELVAAYWAGARMSELADRYQVHRTTVSAILLRQGVPARTVGMTCEQVDLAVQMYEQGSSLASIGTHFGVDAGTVHDRLRERAVPMRDTRGRKRD